MLNQKRSGSLARLKYLLAVPIFLGLLCASTLAFSKTYGWVDIGPHRIDKNNHSAQVPEPKRSLSVTQNGKRIITDKFSFKRDNGTIRVYTGYNLSNKDIVDLAKKGIKVDVLYGDDTDTTKNHVAPPPPPAPPIKAIDNRPPPPPPAPPVTYTKKGYKYKEDGYAINGKTDIQSIDHNNRRQSKRMNFRNKASDADIKLLKDKYGYTFPTWRYTPNYLRRRQWRQFLLLKKMRQLCRQFPLLINI